MKLHILPPSANSHGPVAVVKKLGLENVEIVNAYGKTRTEEFIQMNPCHCCPTVETDDGKAIWESNAILRFLVNSAGEKGHELYPVDPVLRGMLDTAMDWRTTELYPKLTDLGYMVFGMPVSDDKAKEDFAKLLKDVFPILTGTFLKDTQFVYSDTPTIADLSIAPCLTFIQARPKFWAKVPQEVKDYQTRVLEAFPETKENFDMLLNMMTSFEGKEADLEPLEI
mmetsp:Transcript_32264/g.63898  ORF Transcript_32264/g.63898 Transcript_32264/m.63898 type:complete len:225 (+) Transcript_32264:65-739(+)|eukprot:CAMPEP_0194303372 /NCGR_PEP_ID=MMETSP0171-20130528/1243_1 /TAXON_ID=218684 /ORGANISM="Corethron pennatum, Strain L29A3" /LENGTH=224 /DNA_ID=CAMNT_0039054241 /DNA_START=65 /DNA_END=739 /DNA_ORIENTATION=+